MLLPLLTLSLAPSLGWQGHADSATGAEPGQANFNYTYGEFDVGLVDVDVPGADSELGFQLVGSYRAWRDLFVKASYQDSGGDADLSLFKIGAGWAVPLQKGLDAYGLFSIARADVGSADDTGWALEGGVRYMANEQIELNGLLEFVDFEDTEVGLGLGARYYFDDRLSGGVNYETISDFSDTLFFGVRYQF